jgi:hypothetical protein
MSTQNAVNIRFKYIPGPLVRKGNEKRKCGYAEVEI